ncbi:MAG: biotin/lipoyl-binding protein, partial [FCB group bacterium]|nr:biotin/lipoyl-binding protein [FCB group bacterium]
MRRLISMASLGVLVLAGAGCGSSSEETAAAAAQPEVQVTLGIAEKGPVAAMYEAVGTIRSTASSGIQSKATGHVTAVNVREGDRVKQGQVLVELDPREAAAQLQRAQSALREAQAMRREVDTAVEAAVQAKNAAAAGGALAQATYERYKRLTDQNAVSRQAYDEANARWKSASAQTAQAGAMVASVEARRS